jgi:hypothetical protein
LRQEQGMPVSSNDARRPDGRDALCPEIAQLPVR